MHSSLASSAVPVADEPTLEVGDAGQAHAMTFSAVRAGAVRFGAALDRDTACARLADDGWLIVLVEIDAQVRGRLGEAVDHAIERELVDRGALAARAAHVDGPDEALVDRLRRAASVGARGVALFVDPLRALAGKTGALEPYDCAALRFFADATAERPLVLWLDERDARTAGYGEPVHLAELLGCTSPRVAMRAALAGFTPEPDPTSPEVPGAGPRPAPRAMQDDDEQTETDEPIETRAAADPPRALVRLAHGPAPSPLAAPDASARSAESHGASEPLAPAASERDDTWRTWTRELSAARGPQPLSALEKLFTESYMPLANAIAAGLDDSRARAAHDEFRQTFARGYADAFPTFASTTKRPRMVFDAFDAAGRIARLHGARSTRLLLVDGMRWDVSRLVEQHLGAKLGSRAAITDEMLLWSALPTTTMRQLETIARGVDALRSPAELEPDADVPRDLPRGRTAEYVRRLRVGPRELHKLDLVESRLSGSRGTVLRALEAVAETTAEVIARHAETLAPHTLLFVFGDHGFTIDRSGSASQGGASPEEVLVGGFSLLVGDVH